MTENVTAQEELVAWMGEDHARMAAAARAEAEVNRSNWLLRLEPGSDSFYRSVLCRARKRIESND